MLEGFHDRLPPMTALPKIDLHRHLEGSIRLDSIHALRQGSDRGATLSRADVGELIQVQAYEPKSHIAFLSKFEPIRSIFNSPETIRRLTSEVVEDAAADGIRYLELHFTPAALCDQAGFALRDVFTWVQEAALQASEEFGIRLGLIASVNRHEPVQVAEAVVELAAEFHGRGVAGLSLAGNEADYGSEPFTPAFDAARQVGLGISVHAGEWAGPESVRYALETMQASRIGHGVRVLEDPAVTALARERAVVFEVCITSNAHSGVVSSIRDHPLARMIQAGLRVTINTDDPTISNITLSGEYTLAIEQFGLSIETLKGLILTASQAAFLPLAERRGLEDEFIRALFSP